MYHCLNIFVVHRVYTLVIGKLAGFLCHVQLSSFREDTEYATYGDVQRVGFNLLVAVLHRVLQYGG